jgi:hypothetical protein
MYVHPYLSLVPPWALLLAGAHGETRGRELASAAARNFDGKDGEEGRRAGVGLVLCYEVIGALVGQLVGGGVTAGLQTWMVRPRLGVDIGLTSTWKLYISAVASAAASYPITWLAGCQSSRWLSGR